MSKILFSTCGTTTVIIFFLLYTGAFVNIVGSIEAAVMIYGINTTILIPATIWYVIERSHRTDRESESAILEAYSKKALQDGDDTITSEELNRRSWAFFIDAQQRPYLPRSLNMHSEERSQDDRMQEWTLFHEDYPFSWLLADYFVKSHHLSRTVWNKQNAPAAALLTK